MSDSEGSAHAGSEAPDFRLRSDRGEWVSLSDFRGRTVVLYFYPKDDTPGCTTEACQFRDSFPRFSGGDAIILGVSPDSVESHARFKARYGLPFTLLADTDHLVAETYGVWALKSFMGREYMGVERTTFIVGPDGRIAHVFAKVKADGHAGEVAAFLGAAEVPGTPARTVAGKSAAKPGRTAAKTRGRTAKAKK